MPTGLIDWARKNPSRGDNPSRLDAACIGRWSPLRRRLASGVPDTRRSGLGRQLRVGDLVFIRVSALPFRKIAAATGSWTNHVGVVIEIDGAEPIVAESTFPFSRLSAFSRFVARSEGRRVAVARLKTPLTDLQRSRIYAAAKKRLGVWYDGGFDLHSNRQFCSRYAREVFRAGTGAEIGEVVTFAELLSRQPHSDLGFWRLWYFGRIPWNRETVSPGSLLASAHLDVIFDGAATESRRHH